MSAEQWECVGGPMDGKLYHGEEDRLSFYLVTVSGLAHCPSCGPLRTYHAYTLKGNPNHWQYQGEIPEEQVPADAR